LELKRKPFIGVLNIIRFNWHFYAIASLILGTLILSISFLPVSVQTNAYWAISVATFSIVLSLIVSYFVYDVSNLYELNWLGNLDNKRVLNIMAGFDETSKILKSKYENVNLTVCDFYDSTKHTEVSIKRARKSHPPLAETVEVSTSKLPFSNDSFDNSLVILSAHEIRDKEERILFFKELSRVTTTAGQIIVTEHLRDASNFLAYTFGAFHFYSKNSWLQTFSAANLIVVKEIKTTPFVSTFILERNGNTL
jgi:hypothetical protein